MRTLLWGIGAVAAVTVREAMRQRLWILFLVAGVVVMVAGFRLGAVDPSARLKLAVVTITAAIGFVVVLLSILTGSGMLRRDLDGRYAFLLFAKPLPRLGYLLGRLTGVLGVLLVGIISLSALGSAMVAWRFEQTPRMLDVAVPFDWQELSSLGEAVPVTEGRKRVALSGAPGNGVRWSLSGLPTSNLPDGGLDVLLRVQVRGADAGVNIEDCLATVTAAPGAGARIGERRVLPLDVASPYGRGADDSQAGDGQVMLRHRDTTRTDYNQDWMRLKLPAELIASDGSTTIELTRLENRATVTVSKADSLVVAQPGGSLFANLVRGGLVLLASAAMLCAFTLLLGVVSKLGVVLLGGLTLFFAGNVVWTIADTLEYEKVSVPVRRLLEAAIAILPDFDRFTVAARLAASQAVPWSAVAGAWAYYGIFTAFFMALAGLALRRKEL